MAGFRDKKNAFAGCKAFTMIEVSVALIILGMIAATVLVIINNAVDTVVMWQTKMQAFEIARENMEQILAKSSVSDMVEYGTSETNPDITYETTVESFYEPITSRMWIRAVCSAEFPDPNGQQQKVELTLWLTGLNQKQIMMILEQKKKLAEYQMTLDEFLRQLNDKMAEKNPQGEDSSQQQQQDIGAEGEQNQDLQNLESTDPELQKAIKELLGDANGK